MQLKKIVVIGPESTGKSSLCEGLANHFRTIWVREYAREYLLAHGTHYSFDDLYTIAQGQLRLEEEAEKTALENNSRLLIVDTDMYVMKVWSEFVFNRCDNRILNQIVERHYEFYLLANTDLPWVKDELREYPDLVTREKLFHHYKDLLVHQNTPWALVSGIGQERIHNAIHAVENHLQITQKTQRF